MREQVYMSSACPADTFFCVVDLHAVTLPHEPKDLLEATRKSAALYIAAGINPDSASIFGPVTCQRPRRASMASAVLHADWVGPAAQLLPLPLAKSNGTCAINFRGAAECTAQDTCQPKASLSTMMSLHGPVTPQQPLLLQHASAKPLHSQGQHAVFAAYRCPDLRNCAIATGYA